MYGLTSWASTFLREQGLNAAWIGIQPAQGKLNEATAGQNHAGDGPTGAGYWVDDPARWPVPWQHLIAANKAP